MSDDSKVAPALPLRKLIILDQKESDWYKKIEAYCSSPRKFPTPLSPHPFIKASQEPRLVEFSEQELLTLIKISLVDEKLSSQLEQKKTLLKEFWQSLGNSLYGKAYPLHPHLEPLCLLKGKLLYFEYQKMQVQLENPEPNACASHESYALNPLENETTKHSLADAFLQHAAWSFYYYEALDVLAWKIVEGNASLSQKKIAEALELAKIASIYYGCVGYILLSKIANACASKLPSTQKENKLTLYALAYKALESAEKCLDSSKELTEIAYHFESLSAYNDSIPSFWAAKKIIFSNMITILSPQPVFINFFTDKVRQRQEVFYLANRYINNIKLNLSARGFERFEPQHSNQTSKAQTLISDPSTDAKKANTNTISSIQADFKIL